MDDRDARIRARNEASINADLEQYAARQARRDSLIEEAKRDYADIERQRREQAEFNIQFEARNKPQYEAAYQVLAEMLDGQRRLSLPLAVFVVENSYAAGGLSYATFQANLDELADICRGLAGPDAGPASRFMALHRLMTDTVPVSAAGKVVARHLPYRYDFNDFRGEQDYDKMFVTKLLRTNSGQCHSLPLLYKMLADRLEVKTNISMAPNHSYIQVQGPGGQLYSYETTNGRFVTDAYYMTTGFVKTAALKSRAYLDTLTLRQNIACQVQDLALGYAHYYGHDAFTEKCAALALKHYPQSVQARILAHTGALSRFARAYQAVGSPPRDQALQLPTLKPLWADVQRRQQALNALGYEEIPKERYARWLQSAEEEKHRQESRQAAARFLQPAQK